MASYHILMILPWFRSLRKLKLYLARYMVGLIDLNGSYMGHRYTDDMYM